MLTHTSIRERGPRRARRAAFEQLEPRQVPSTAGVGHVLHRIPALVARSEHRAIAEVPAPPNPPPAFPPYAPSLDVPMRLVTVRKQNSNLTQKRLAVDVTVAGVTRPYLLDTGSSGMYVAKYGLNKSLYTKTSTSFVQGYSSGIQYSGNVMSTGVSFAGGPTAWRVYVGLIQSVRKIPGWSAHLRAHCPPYDHHFYGTLGMSLMPGKSKKGGLYSIIAQLPGNLNTGFIVHSGGIDGRSPTLTIGLNSENTQGFYTVRMPAADGSRHARPYSYGNGYWNGVPAWNDKGVDVNYRIASRPQFSAPTVFDTGNPTTSLYTGHVPKRLLNGSILENRLLFQANIAPNVGWKFLTGENANVNRVYVGAARSSGTVNTGIGLFFNYDVMYDIADGLIGFRPESYGTPGT